ncbi:MAG: PAS domain-containing protein [Thermoplasmata archaeon]|nr:MAG: PAS domain-containing protein [Thermoplasmata archaeon]
MEDIARLLGRDYSFFKLDERGNFILNTLPCDAATFIEIVGDEEKAKAAKLIYDALSKKEAEGVLHIKNDDAIEKYLFRLILKDDEILGVAKKIDEEKPSFITDFMGNVIQASKEWEWLLGSNIFDEIEGKERFFKLISEAIERGEKEEKGEINDRKVRIKIRAANELQFYIKDDFEELLKDIVKSKSEKEIMENVCRLLDSFSYGYEIKIGNELRSKDNEGYFFYMEFEGGYAKIYGEKRAELDLLPLAISIAMQSFKKDFLAEMLPLCVLNGNGNIVSINKKFSELTGYGEEIIGENINKISLDGSGEIKKWKGKNRTFWAKEKAIKFGGKTYLIIEDVTKEKEKMDENEFLNSILRHDIFNKNQIALGYIGLLEKTNLNKKQKSYVEKAKTGIEEGNRLIQSIRELNEIRKERKLRKINVGKLLRDICSSFEEEAKKAGITISCNVKNATVIADELVSEIFSNIIKNSIEHSNASHIEINGRNLDGALEITIEDDGRGIPKEFLEDVFKQGWRRDSEGSGLGLYIVKKLMERYGGNVRIESEEGKGTKVVLHFRKGKQEKDFFKIRL